MQRAQVAHEQQSGSGPPAEQLGALLPGLVEEPGAVLGGRVGRLDSGAVALPVRCESLEVGVGDPLERLGEVEDVVVGLVALAEGVELARERLLCVADVPDGQAELHGSVDSAMASVPPLVTALDGSSGAEAVFVGAGAGPSSSATFTTVTAPALKSGCLETGSQSVMVSSFAAREAPSPWSHQP